MWTRFSPLGAHSAMLVLRPWERNQLAGFSSLGAQSACWFFVVGSAVSMLLFTSGSEISMLVFHLWERSQQAGISFWERSQHGVFRLCKHKD